MITFNEFLGENSNPYFSSRDNTLKNLDSLLFNIEAVIHHQMGTNNEKYQMIDHLKKDFKDIKSKLKFWNDVIEEK